MHGTGVYGYLSRAKNMGVLWPIWAVINYICAVIKPRLGSIYNWLLLTTYTAQAR